MTKENAEKFYALYQQHKAIAKRLAELDAKSEEELVAGLAALAHEMGLDCTADEIEAVIGFIRSEGVAGGNGFGNGLGCSGQCWNTYMSRDDDR